MRTILIFVSIFMASFFASGQTTVFKTYEDYLHGSGEKMDNEYADYSYGTASHSVKFKNIDGNIVKYKSNDIWGFLFQGKLFRSVGKYDIAMLVDTGRINFYTDGYLGMNVILHPNKKYITTEFPLQLYSSYLSVGDMSTRVYRMPDQIKHDYNDFKADYPDFEDLYDCFHFKGNMSKYPEEVRECVKEFNSVKKRKAK
jgi:hypothetical protein